VQDEPGNEKWVFWGGDSGYKLGSFDGKKFTPDTEKIVATAGQYYAAQTYSDIPTDDGRCIQIGWLREGKFPDMPFNQQMSFPIELKLRRFDDGLRLCMLPVKEIGLIRNHAYSHKPRIVSDSDANMLQRTNSELLEIQADFSNIKTEKFGFNLRGTELLYDAKNSTLKCRDANINVKPINGKISLHILIDKTSIEIFANRGRESIFLSFPLDTENKSLQFFTRVGSVKVDKMDIWRLNGTWH
jgi:sucrose-6-phosphate hydrolase SacC (GH32 family)